MRGKDELVAAEEIGTGTRGHVQQGHPRESKIPPQPAGRRRKGTHAVMAAAVHVAFYYNGERNGALIAKVQGPGWQYLGGIVDSTGQDLVPLLRFCHAERSEAPALGEL